MNKKLVFAITLVCLIVFVSVFAFSQTSASVRWEYTFVQADSSVKLPVFQEKVKELGAQGWEWCGDFSLYNSYVAFKRRLP